MPDAAITAPSCHCHAIPTSRHQGKAFEDEGVCLPSLCFLEPPTPHPPQKRLECFSSKPGQLLHIILLQLHGTTPESQLRRQPSSSGRRVKLISDPEPTCFSFIPAPSSQAL